MENDTFHSRGMGKYTETVFSCAFVTIKNYTSPFLFLPFLLLHKKSPHCECTEIELSYVAGHIGAQ